MRLDSCAWRWMFAVSLVALGSGAAVAGLIRQRQIDHALHELKLMGGSLELACPHWCPRSIARNAESLMADQLRVEFVDSDTPLVYIAHQLQQLPQRICLSVQRASLQNSDFQHLKTITNLEAFSITESSMTDRSLSYIAELPKLKCLAISGAQLTHRGCRTISGMRQLEHLGLIGAPITDGDIAELAKLSRLTILDLRGTYASDRCLAELAKLPRLTYLDVRGTQVSAEGVRRLQTSRPNLEIHFN